MKQLITASWPDDFWTKLCKTKVPNGRFVGSNSVSSRGEYVLSNGDTLFFIYKSHFITAKDVQGYNFELAMDESHVPSGAVGKFISDMQTACKKLGLQVAKTPKDLVPGTYILGRGKNGLQLRVMETK